MKNTTFVFLLLLSCASFANSAVSLQVNGLINPIGIDMRSISFSWKGMGGIGEFNQDGYELELYSQELRRPVWRSGFIKSSRSLCIRYDGASLAELTRYRWRVRILSDCKPWSPWSAFAFFVTGLRESANLEACWISTGSGDSAQQVPFFRRTFDVKPAIKAAYLCVSSHGVYDCLLNGKRVNRGYFAPGWTSYAKRLQYQVYDVSDKLVSGGNALGIMVADGWFKGHVGSNEVKNFYGRQVALAAHLVIKYEDGSIKTMDTDSSWRYSFGEVRSAEFFDGDSIDYRQERSGWTSERYNDIGWVPASVRHFDKRRLVAQENEPVQQLRVLRPVKRMLTPNGELVFDFGQNFAGWAEMAIKGSPGQLVRVSYAEVLDKEGNFYMENMRGARPVDRYVLSGGTRLIRPLFTYHGFRYIRIEGAEAGLVDSSIKGIVIGSVPTKTGTFSCSDNLVNKLQENIDWGLISNFIDIPTDCPQRDERLGWTGDAQVFCPTAAFNREVYTFFRKWLRDLYADQLPSGAVPVFIPNLGRTTSSAGWSDAVTIIPWNLFLSYGDTSVLQEAYPAMKAWLSYIEGHSRKGLWDQGFHYGDWLFYRPDNDDFGRSAITDRYLIAQCFAVRSCDVALKTATILDDRDGQEHYRVLARVLREAFGREYLSTSGRLSSNTQTAYSLAIAFDLVPDSLRPVLGQRLVDNVKDYKCHLTTGFLGTPYICEALYKSGFPEIADSLLMQKTYPSWLYPVTMGATTLWERWDGIKPDSSFQWAYRNSFNHYSYGAVGQYLYSRVGGISCLEDGVGYKHSLIKPFVFGRITSARTSLETPYGLLRVSWENSGSALVLEAKIPPGTRSTLVLPILSTLERISLNGQPIKVSSPGTIVTPARELAMELGSGNYHFLVK